jgi:hypothetical protein
MRFGDGVEHAPHSLNFNAARVRQTMNSASDTNSLDTARSIDLFDVVRVPALLDRHEGAFARNGR